MAGDTSARLRDALREALRSKKRLEEELRAVREEGNEPIAVVGLSYRFPGAEYGGLWELVVEGREARSPIPQDRLWRPVVDEDGNTMTHGSFLGDIWGVPRWAGALSPEKSRLFSPDMRLAVETAFMACEDAGLVPVVSTRGQRGGVYLGLSYNTFARVPGDTDSGVADRVTGNMPATAAGFLAYALGWEGPALVLDTACSSSLVAMHLAVRDLRSGDCDIAMAGGSSIAVTAESHRGLAMGGGLALDGRCRSFAEDAGGTAFSEGAGWVVLKRLSDALEAGDTIRGVIRGTAVNQDGRSNGFTAPSGPRQEAVIRAALADARLRPADIDAIEAHGTGTALGDPIEATALSEVYGRNREQPLHLGSVKANLGHMQAAAGVGGLVKMVMALEHETLPPTLHSDRPSPHIDWTGPVQLVTEPTPWPRSKRRRRAGISSFGITGTNAHVILEEAPEKAVGKEEPSVAFPLVVGGSSYANLRSVVGALAMFLAGDDSSLRDVAYTIGVKRLWRATWRFTMVIRPDASREEVIAALETFARTGVVPRHGAVGEPNDGKALFLFTGQGSQRAGMGAGLYGSLGVFRAAFDACCAALAPHLTLPEGYISLQQLVFDAEAQEQLTRTEMAQPALFALEVALCRYWQSIAIQPDLVAGHSIGEVVAAHIAGVFDLQDAARLVAARGALMASHARAGGSMVAVAAPEEQVLAAIGSREDVVVAGVNGPSQTVVSGRPEAVDAVVDALAVRSRSLAVSHAFHSPDLDGMLEAFREVAESVTYRKPSVPIISGLTGQLAEPEDIATADYWVRQVREAVRFGDVLATARSAEVGITLECGPSGVLTALGAEALSEAHRAASLERDVDEGVALAAAMGALYAGLPRYHVQNLQRLLHGQFVPVPTPFFDREHIFPDLLAGDAASPDALGVGAGDHAILKGWTTIAAQGQTLVFGAITPRRLGWVADHAMYKTVLYPGTGLLEVALEALEQARPVGVDGVAQIDELVLQAPLVLAQDAVAVQVLVRPGAIEIFSRPSAEVPWTPHAAGRWSFVEAPAEGMPTWPPPDAEPVALEGLYEMLAMLGYDYGPAFQGLSAAWVDEAGVMWAEARLPSPLTPAGHRIHPALLDTVFHTPMAVVRAAAAARMREAAEAAEAGIELPPTTDTEADTAVQLPFGFAEAVVWYDEASEVRVRVAPSAEDGPQLMAWTPSGTPVMRIGALWSRPASPVDVGTRTDTRNLFRVEWVPSQRERAGALPPSVVVLGGERSPAAAQLVAALRRRGVTVSEWSEAGVPEARDAVWLLDWAAPEGGELAERAQHAVQSALARVQAVLGSPPRRQIWLTSGAVHVEAPDPAQRAVWGFGRTAQNEHPELELLLVDVAEDCDVSAVIDAVFASQEGQLAVRGDQLVTPRLTRSVPVDAAWSASGSVAVVVGSGALGRVTAEHLVSQHGVRTVVLASRRGPDSESSVETAASLEALGAERVELVACDVTCPTAVESLVERVAELGEGVGFVVHTAGVLRDGVVQGLTEDAVSEVLEPKVTGAVTVAEAFRRRFEGTRYVFYSSVAGVLGSLGQSNYAAANLFLDGYAEWLRSEGEQAVSLAWGLWAALDGSMASQGPVRSSAFGAVELTPVTGMALFDSALAAGVNAVPMAFEQAAIQRMWDAGSRIPMFSRLVNHSSAPVALTSGPMHRSRAELNTLVREVVAAALGLGSGRQVPMSQSFSELGLDSLMAIEVRNQLMQLTGQSLPPTLLFDYPTVESLVSLLEESTEEEEVVSIDWDAVRQLPIERLEESGALDLLRSLLGAENSEPIDGDEFLDEMEEFLGGALD